jgi:hypothetical protein
MHYVEIEDAIAKPGLRLVLTPHVPGPYGEAAKAAPILLAHRDFVFEEYLELPQDF